MSCYLLLHGFVICVCYFHTKIYQNGDISEMRQDLREYGFTDDYNELRCRKCNSIINKYGITTLLGTSVKYGCCRWYTHGYSVVKLMK